MRYMMHKKHEGHMGHEGRAEHHHHEMHGQSDVNRALTHVRSTIERPPHTWESYKGKPGEHWGIIEMEIGELQAAHSAMKMGTGTHAAFVKELCDVAAACAAAYAAMTCDK